MLAEIVGPKQTGSADVCRGRRRRRHHQVHGGPDRAPRRRAGTLLAGARRPRPGRRAGRRRRASRSPRARSSAIAGIVGSGAGELGRLVAGIEPTPRRHPAGRRRGRPASATGSRAALSAASPTSPATACARAASPASASPPTWRCRRCAATSTTRRQAADRLPHRDRDLQGAPAGPAQPLRHPQRRQPAEGDHRQVGADPAPPLRARRPDRRRRPRRPRGHLRGPAGTAAGGHGDPPDLLRARAAGATGGAGAGGQAGRVVEELQGSAVTVTEISRAAM